MMVKRESYQTMCRMCDDHCGINVYVENGEIVDIDGIKDHPWNKGKLCIKGKMGVDLVNSKDRILKPLKRVGDSWEEISLDKALDEIAEKIQSLQSEYGNQTMSVWKGEAIGFMTQEDIARRFIHAIGSPNYFSNDSQCFVGRYVGYSLVSGVWPSPDFEESKCIVLWGSNPPHAHPSMTQAIMKARKNGAKLIVIDSRLSAIAKQADIFLQIKPGTDGALAHGIARELITNKDVDYNFINRFTVGYKDYSEYVSMFTPEYVAKETGIQVNVLIEVARQMALGAPQVVNYVGNGLEHHENGINNIRAVACLDGLLGSLDAKGGNFVSERPKLRKLTLYEELPLLDLEPIGRDKYPVLYDFRQECHTMMAMDTMINGKPYPLKGMILTGANPVLTNPNTNKVIKALKALELFVVRDLFMTETAQLADYILPAASYLERSELFYYPGLQNLGLSKRVKVYPDCQDEYDFWHDLAHRLSVGQYFPWESEEELNEWLLTDTGITVNDLAAHPESLNCMPKHYKKYKSEKLNTPSGKFEFTSDYLADYGYQLLPEYFSPKYLSKPSEDYPFVMITGARKANYLHGRNKTFKTTRTTMQNPEIELHPEDAKELEVETGDIVKVTSSVGSIEIPVKIVKDREIKTRVVQITHGWRKANVNMLTHDDINDPINGFPLMKAVEVRLEKCHIQGEM